MPAKKLVIFDFDGVLVDTILMCHAIHKEIDDKFTFEEYKKLGNGNFHEEIAKLHADGRNIHHPEFQKIYDDKICDINVPPALKVAVADLASKYPLAIISSGLTSAIQEHLKREGIIEHFSEILGYDFHKSKVFKFKKLLADYSIEGKDAVMITDSLGDILEAHEAGIPSIAVSWGLHDRETFLGGNPAAIIDQPEELIPQIERILG